jgi:hypothetical protein
MKKWDRSVGKVIGMMSTVEILIKASIAKSRNSCGVHSASYPRENMSLLSGVKTEKMFRRPLTFIYSQGLEHMELYLHAFYISSLCGA